MSAMQQQNANMALLQKRGDGGAALGGGAGGVGGDAREPGGLAFMSSLPVVSNGDPMTAHGVELPIYMSKTTDAITGPPHVAPDEDYDVFIRDAAGPHHRDNDLGPALDAGAPFVVLGSSANDLAGQLGKEMGVGVPGVNNPSAKLLVRRGGLDVDDDVGSIVGDSAFIFPGPETVERAVSEGERRERLSGPGAERPAPGGGAEARPRLGARTPRTAASASRAVRGAERGAARRRRVRRRAGSRRDVDPRRRRVAQARRGVPENAAARMRALGVAPETAPNDADAPEFEQL